MPRMVVAQALNQRTLEEAGRSTCESKAHLIYTVEIIQDTQGYTVRFLSQKERKKNRKKKRKKKCLPRLFLWDEGGK